MSCGDGEGAYKPVQLEIEGSPEGKDKRGMRAKVCPYCGRAKRNINLHLRYCKEWKEMGSVLNSVEKERELTGCEKQEAQVGVLVRLINKTVEEAREFDDNKREDILQDIIIALEGVVEEYC